MERLKIDKSKLTFSGSMNYIVQAIRSEENPDMVFIHNYMPRKGSISNNEESVEETKKLMIETIERMKIAINLMQDFIEDKVQSVYYWQEEDGK